jgi:methyl-accepting chemotaxis protein
MKGFKDLTNELSEMKVSIEDLTKELHEVKSTIAQSLKLATNAMNDLSESFSNTMGDVVKKMSEMKVQLDIKDNILKTLGIDAVLPDFLKKKK